MGARNIRSAVWALASSLIVLLVTGCATAQDGSDPVAASQPLRILLTNDDGYDAPGIRALRKVLMAHGHDVTVVAPLANRSGSSGSITTRGGLDVVEQEKGVWSVDGTPSDAVMVGLEVVLAEAPPDVVVSGANFGQNIGPATLISGTVGAALAAMRAGAPAVAVSVGIDVSEAGAEPHPFPSTLAAFPGAGELTARLLDTLAAARPSDGALLPPQTVVNLNYPALDPAALAGVSLADIGLHSTFSLGYRRDGDRVEIAFRPPPPGKDGPRADTSLFAEGYATITLLDGDVQKRGPEATRLESALAPLLGAAR